MLWQFNFQRIMAQLAQRAACSNHHPHGTSLGGRPSPASVNHSGLYRVACSTSTVLECNILKGYSEASESLGPGQDSLAPGVPVLLRARNVNPVG